MRARDARDLARLAQAALQSLTDVPPVRLVEDADAPRLRRAREGVAVAGVVLGHLYLSLSSEAARKRSARRRPVDELLPAVPDSLELTDPTDGTRVRVERASEYGVATVVVTGVSGAYLTGPAARELARWLLAVAADERRPT